jgi:hypothetical protein
MACKTIKDTKSTKYKHVLKTEVNDNVYWRVNITGVSKIGYKTEREARLQDRARSCFSCRQIFNKQRQRAC